jgi:hypothetical protein
MLFRHDSERLMRVYYPSSRFSWNLYDYGPDGPGLIPGIARFFLFTASRQPPNQGLSGLKRPGREANHSPSSSAEVKNGAHSPICLHGLMLSYLSAGTSPYFTLPSRLSVAVVLVSGNKETESLEPSALFFLMPWSSALPGEQLHGRCSVTVLAPRD